MDEHSYLNFELLIERYQGSYQARVLNSPAGQALQTFEIPFSDLEIENFILRVGRSRRSVRRLDSPEMELSRIFGGKLFETIFNDEVRDRLRASLNEARRQDRGLRIQLRMTEVPELVNLPWEYLYDPDLKQFLVLSTQTPIVRFLDLPRRIQPVQVDLPLDLLVMISSPSDYPSLNVEEEWRKLQKSLEDLEQQELIRFELLEKATLTNLQRKLRRGSYNIFHFIGHGGYDETTKDGILLFEDEAKKGHRVSGDYLGTLLHDEPSIRLAVLNACEGARTSYDDPFAGVAQNLVLRGTPSVIAMQFEITDEAAIIFAHEFYGALADGYPVDASLAEARKAIYTQGNDIEWGTPVLYLRAPDGRIFDIPQTTKHQKEPPMSLTLESKELSVMPGESVATKLTIRNSGLHKASFGISIYGIPDTWIQKPLPDIQLSPGEKQEFILTFRPPRSPGSRAGQYQLTYRITNKDTNEQIIEEKATLTVAKFSQIVGNIHPKQINVGQNISVEMRNEGNIQETCVLVVEDLSGSLEIHPPNAEVKISEGKSTSSKFRVDSLTKNWIGGKKSHPLSVKITSSMGAVQRLRGEAISRGLVPLWVIPAIIFLCFVLFASGVGLYPMLFPLPVTDRTQTATATATHVDLTDSDPSTTPTNTPIPSPTRTIVPPTPTNVIIVPTNTPEPILTPIPRIDKIEICSQPCNGSNDTRKLPEKIDDIYVRWDYENIPKGAHYERSWTLIGRGEWVRYVCKWYGPESGISSPEPLHEPEGFESGKWVITISVNGQELIREEFIIEGSYIYWEPLPDPIPYCFDPDTN